MSPEQRKTLTCPACGNMNVYTADTCIKCGLNLEPIRSALLAVSPLKTQPASLSAPQPDSFAAGLSNSVPKSDGNDMTWRPSGENSPVLKTVIPQTSISPTSDLDPMSRPARPLAPTPISKSQPRHASTGKLLGRLLLGIGGAFILWGLFISIADGYLKPNSMLIGAVVLLIGWLLQREGSTAAGPTDLQLRQKWSKAIIGAVRDFQQREELVGPSGVLHIWTFVIDRYDESGNRLPPVPVEMRSYSFQGVINEGDRVEIAAKWHEGVTLHPRSLRNLTTGGKVSARTWSSCGGTAVIVVLLLGLALAVITFISEALQH